VAYELFTGRVLPAADFCAIGATWFSWHWIQPAGRVGAGHPAPADLQPAADGGPDGLFLCALELALFCRARTDHGAAPSLCGQPASIRVGGASTRSDMDTAALFGSLCGDLLGARQAWLVPMGSLAPLLGAPIVYPEGQSLPRSPIPEIAPHAAYMPLDPACADGAALAVPLWSERG